MRLSACALCMFVASAGGVFITTGRENLCTEDPGIKAELRRRLDHDDLIRSFRPHKIPPSMLPKFSDFGETGSSNTEAYEPVRNKVTRKSIQADNKANKKVNKLANNQVNNKGSNKVNKTINNKVNNRGSNKVNKTINYKGNNTTPKLILSTTSDYRRRWGLTRDYFFDPIVPPDRAVRHKMIDLAEQAIYAAQYRLKDLEIIAVKYSEVIEYRIAYIIKRLELIEYEMELIYSYFAPYAAHSWDSKIRLFVYLIYYEEVLMKHVDVTYMCERLMLVYGTHEKQRLTDKARGEQDFRTTPSGFNFTGEMDRENMAKLEMERDARQKQQELDHGQGAQNGRRNAHQGY